MKRFWCWLWGHKLHFNVGAYKCDRCHNVKKAVLTRRDIFGRFG